MNKVERLAEVAIAKSLLVADEVNEVTHPELVSIATALSGSAEDLTRGNAEIAQLRIDLSLARKERESLKNGLFKCILLASLKLQAVGIVNKDSAIVEPNLTLTALRAMGDKKLDNTAMIYLTKVKENASRLAKLGYTATDEGALGAAKAAFTNAGQKIQRLEEKAAQCTSDLELQYSSVALQVNQLDILVKSYANEMPTLFQSYFSIKQQGNAVKGKPSVAGIIFTDGSSPLANATVEFFSVLENGSNEPALMRASAEPALEPVLCKRTGSNGGFTAKLKPGKYVAKISKQGFDNKELVVYVNNNEKTTVKSALDRV